MDHKNYGRLLKGLYVVFILSTFLKGYEADESLKVGMDLQELTSDEMREQIKDLLEKRPERPDTPDFIGDFEDLFEKLNKLATRMPAGFVFNWAQLGLKDGHPTLLNERAMKCLKDGNKFTDFLRRLPEIIKELHDDITDSVDVDSSDKSDNDTSSDIDTVSNSTDSSDTDDKKSTQPKDSDGDDHTRRRRDAGEFELDDLLEKLQDDDLECLSGFVSKGDKEFLCRRYAQGSAAIFARMPALVIGCEEYLDDDEPLNGAHQIALISQLKAAGWDDNRVKQALRLAPEALDDDFLEDLKEDLFEKHIQQFARLATRRSSNPSLLYAFREKLDDDIKNLTPEKLRNIGPGLFSLSHQQIQSLNMKVLLDSDTDDLFDDKDDDEDDDDSKEQVAKPSVRRIQVRDDDDDDDDDDDARLAIGLRMKQAIRESGQIRPHIRKGLSFLHDDLDFVRSIDPDDLFESMSEIQDLDFDDDDAKSVFYQMTQSARFPPVTQLSGHNLTGMGHLLRGMAISQMMHLRKDAIEEALDKIKDIDFDDSQAQVILGDLIDEDDELEKFQVENVRRLGKLFRGIQTNQIVRIKSDVIESVLDDLDDIDLSDAQKRIISSMARQQAKLPAKFLTLPSFAQVLSVPDLDDLDDDDIQVYMNVSGHLNWRLPQAAELAHRYIHATASHRLQLSQLAIMGKVASGLVPDDLDDLMKTPEDILELAEKLKDIKDDLTSGQIDEMVERYSDLLKTDIEIDDIKATQGAFMFAHLKPEEFTKLRFSKPGQLAFVTQLARMSTQKMSASQIQFLATMMLNMLEDSDDSKEVKISEDKESRRLRSLGQMALGLTAPQLKSFSGKALFDNLNFLRSLPLTKEQASAILDKMDDIAEKWHCRPDIMARLGPLLLHDDSPLSDECDFEERKGLLSTLSPIMKGLEKRREMIKERLEEGFDRELLDDFDDGEKRLVNAMVLLATQSTKPNTRRRRAATVEGPLTCDVIARLKSSARHVEPQRLASMRDDDFSNCLPTLGSIRDWPQQSLQTLASRTKEIYSDVGNWTNEIIRRAGSIISALTPEEIERLALNGVDVMNSVAKHGLLSIEQLKAGFRRWLSLSGKANVTQVTEGEFSSLSHFVCGIEPADIQKINVVIIKRSIDVIGRSLSCETPQQEAYIQKVIESFGTKIDSWSPAIVGDMGHLIAALNVDQLKTLTTNQLSLIAPSVIKYLPQEKITALTTVQFKSLSTNQVNAITEVQYKALTAEQQKMVDTKTTIAFPQVAGTTSSPGSNNRNGAAVTTCSLLLLLSAFLVFIG